MDIETARARQVENAMKENESQILPIAPSTDSVKVKTHFWVDNYDQYVDFSHGSPSINITTMMAFQENGQGTVNVSNDKPVERNRSRILEGTLSVSELKEMSSQKCQPPQIPFKPSADQER